MQDSSYVVAVIDDDELMRDALRNLLWAFDCDVELYDSAEAFLAAVAETKASCLLSDIQLGGMSGIELGRKLAAAGSTFPTIFMTASQDETTRERAMELGCIAFLTKPFAPLALAEALIAAGKRSETSLKTNCQAAPVAELIQDGCRFDDKDSGRAL